MNIKTLTLYQDRDCFDDVICQELYDGDTELLFVHNLNECPEDAIIGRDLFTATDCARAIKYGIELAKQGYDDIEIRREEK